MVALSLAVVDRNNRPLYLEEFVDPTSPPPSDEEMMGIGVAPSVQGGGDGGGGRCSIRHQFILLAALDRMDTLIGLQADGKRDGMFLGLLMPVDEMRVYGTCGRVVIWRGRPSGRSQNAVKPPVSRIRHVHENQVPCDS